MSRSLSSGPGCSSSRCLPPGRSQCITDKPSRRKGDEAGFLWKADIGKFEVLCAMFYVHGPKSKVQSQESRVGGREARVGMQSRVRSVERRRRGVGIDGLWGKKTVASDG